MILKGSLADVIFYLSISFHAGTLKSDCSSKSPRKRLLDNWASMKRIFTRQSLEEVQEYFGVNIALYYAWLGFYTQMLIPATVVGLICFIYGLSTMSSDIPSIQVC